MDAFNEVNPSLDLFSEFYDKLVPIIEKPSKEDDTEKKDEEKKKVFLIVFYIIFLSFFFFLLNFSELFRNR